MKKLIALLLAAMLLLSMTAVLAEETVIQSSDGIFSLSFQLPEDVKLHSGNWVDDRNYMANLHAEDGLYFYLAVSAPAAEEASDTEETVPVTYSEENGYTDSYLEDMIRELFYDDSDQMDLGVKTTSYGTKLAMVRFNDESAPSAYVFTVWNGYEVGLTLVAVDEEGHYVRVTDEQVDRVVSFVSELWMQAKAPAD